MSDRISGHTELLTLMGDPIRHSNSPRMHNAALEYLGLDYVYLCFEVNKDELKSAIDGMRAFKVRGGNITMPNKLLVMDYLDEVSEQARLCGAVNTIVNDNGYLTGYNTDGIGFVMGLKDKGIDPAGKKVVIAGAGGAGKPVQIELARAGVKEMTIFNRHDEFWERASETTKIINENTDCSAALFDLYDHEKLKAEIASCDILVNATSVGMKPMENETWLPDASYLRPELVVCDVIYSPAETLFLKIARETGCTTMNGLPMMLFQGAAAFKMWTGQDMPIDHVKNALNF